MAACDKEELDMLAEKNPQVKKAVAKLMALSEDEQARMLADSREKLRRDIAAVERAAEMRGREVGREEALLSVARNMLAAGRPLAEVALATGLPQDTLRALLH
ncbi:MAG: hypothetical protein LBG78_02365 [Azoarcus sp.]|jgi:predicted transposase/invertase (TIGR01784 family)|nr:hypothetical protein [Azoarcus sp.]